RLLDERVVAAYRDEVCAALADRCPSAIVAEPPGPANTSHLSVMDGEGLAVGLTTTAGESAGYIVPGTGYIANNMLGEEDLHPRGFHTRPAGQRIPTMMTPAVILHGGRPRLVVGSGGSARIRSAILQTLSNLLDYRLPLDDAVNRARVHLDGEVLQCEAGYDPRAVDALENMGYRVNRWSARSIYFGGAHSVARDDAGRLWAAGDNRRGGATAAVEG
ncbi:MAG: gamma-glutamyltransferase family protein, partial [Candidatus Promineofilum sp.]|nr:gamma-glutamyltransferase family protein [Promineifilum sp.]